MTNTGNRWIISGGRVLKPAPFLLMGILNLSPESFSDAARGISRQPRPPENGTDGLRSFAAEGRSMAQEGAHVLDLGGESTRPGAEALSAEEEARRVLPALAALLEEFSKDTPPERPALSVDTYKAKTARSALESGAEIINDISAWSFDPELKEALLEHKPGYVLMHCQGRPDNMQAAPLYNNVLEEVYAFLDRKLEELVRAGFPEERVVIDPGICFGKKLEHNLALLKHIDRFYSLGRPVLVGISYKSFLGGLTGAALERRGGLTLAASALLAQRGVWAHRVHDVAAVKEALQLAHSLAGVE